MVRTHAAQEHTTSAVTSHNNRRAPGRGVSYVIHSEAISRDRPVRMYKRHTRPLVKRGSLVEAGSNTSTVALRVVGGDKKGSLESGTVIYGRESHGTGIREWMRWRGPAAIVNDRPIPSSERMLYKDYDRRCSFEKKNSGREPQGTRRQDELIGGKPPAVK
jgi:hypothetical protein